MWLSSFMSTLVALSASVSLCLIATLLDIGALTRRNGRASVGLNGIHYISRNLIYLHLPQLNITTNYVHSSCHDNSTCSAGLVDALAECDRESSLTENILCFNAVLEFIARWPSLHLNASAWQRNSDSMRRSALLRI